MKKTLLVIVAILVLALLLKPRAVWTEVTDAADRYVISCPNSSVTRSLAQTLCDMGYGRRAGVLAMTARFPDVESYLNADTRVLREMTLSGSRALLITTKGLEGKELIVVRDGTYYVVSSVVDTADGDRFVASFRFVK